MIFIWLFLSLSCSALAETHETLVPVERETLAVQGWNKNCSVAVVYLGYPYLGDASIQDPVMARVGTLTIRPGAEKLEENWLVESDGIHSWDPATAAAKQVELRKAGYSRPGWTETVRPDPIIDDADLKRIILSTDAFKTKAPDVVSAPWRLSEVRYSPVTATCGLLVFKNGEKYALRLIRIGNPTVRKDRARAHLTNGLRLLEIGERPGALAETAIAATMAPDFPLAVYHHAAQLALNGETDAALAELEAAIKQDASLKTRARPDEAFSDMNWMPRFKEITE